MPETTNPYRLRFVILAVFVCIVATFVSNCCGSLASMGYAYNRPPLIETRQNTEANRAINDFIIGVGMSTGTAGGLVASLLWCRWMFKRLRTGEIDQLVKRAIWYGIKVGVLATIPLHIALMLAAGWVPWFDPILGLVFGIVTGMILGAIFGAIYQGMAGPRDEGPTASKQETSSTEPGQCILP